MRLTHLSRIAVATLVALALAGCSRDDSASLVASARSYVAKSDYRAAIIQLKNALTQSPNSGEARLLLARSLLATGDAVGAEAEVRKAMDLRYAPDETYPLLARALLQQGEFRRLVTELDTVTVQDSNAAADLGASLGTAHLALSERSEARAAVDSALAANAKDVRARVLQARLTAQEKDLPQALKLIDDLLAEQPSDVDALTLKYEIQLGQGNRDEAIKTLERAVEAAPSDVRPRVSLISLLVQARQLDRAAAQLEALKKAAPEGISTQYSDALVSAARGDLGHARDAIQQVLKAAPDHLPSVYLAGVIYFQSQSYAAAEDAMRRVVGRVPDDGNARRVLAATYLRTGRPAQALETLDRALKRTPDDPALLRLAAEAYLGTNDAAKATQYFERAAALDKGNVTGRVELAQVRLATGDTERALKDLETLSKSETTSYQADLALISAHLKRGEYDAALAAAATLEKKQPNAPLPYSLKGTIYLAKGDVKAARASFEKALEVDPKFFNAAYNLARLDLADRNYEAARKRYAQVLAKDPNNEAALLAQAELLALTGGSTQEVAAALDRAIAANPTSVRSRLALIALYDQRRDFKAGVGAAQAAQAAMPEDPLILNALGTSQTLAGETSQALETFKKLSRVQPQSATPLLQLAKVQMLTKDFDGAVETIRQAIALQADLPEAWTQMATAFLAAGRPESAIAEGRRYQTEWPDRAVGFAIEGEAYVLRKQWADCATAFANALVHQPTPVLAIRRYVCLQGAGKQAEASAFADKWLKERPRDVALRAAIGELSLAKKDYATAGRYYQAALEVEPNNVIYLNNLAYLSNELGDAKAQKYAEAAYRLAPMNPAVIDTLGWILVQRGDAARGVELLRGAVKLAPNQNDMRLHLAKGLLKTGDKAGAKTELETLAKAEKESPQRDEAQKMLKDL